MDCYYKTPEALHYCKYVGEEMLYTTQNQSWGLYDHGQYPFVLDVLFPTEGSCCGYGYIDYGKNTQKYIDKLNGAILQNALALSRPRWFVRQDGAINEQEYADFTNPIVHAGGNLGDDSVRQIPATPLPSIYETVLQGRITELKETLGNRDAASGGVTASVTSASGIASLQEAAGKLSRDAECTSYRAFEQVVYLCIELIRQFYDVPRSFRIAGAQGQQEFVSFGNGGLRAQSTPLGLRLPQFDIDVRAQKENPYTKESYNELALQLYQMGAFRPDMTDQALLMLELMDFKGKDELVQQLCRRQARLQAAAARMQAMGFAAPGGQDAAGGRAAGQPGGGKAPQLPKNKLSKATRDPKDHPFVQRARQQARSASQPR